MSELPLDALSLLRLSVRAMRVVRCQWLRERNVRKTDCDAHQEELKVQQMAFVPHPEQSVFLVQGEQNRFRHLLS